ncbi:MAG: helix-turn-helix domain-containing protein [Myxococcota bacterium]
MTREVLLWLREGVQLLDVAGPAEVFSSTTRYLEATGRAAGYRLSYVSPGTAPVRSAAGLVLHADADAAPLVRRRSARATLVIPGLLNDPDTEPSPLLLRAVRRWPGRLASVCAGSWRLAQAGRLDGHRATTHWLLVDRMRRHFPAIHVEGDALWTHDGSVWTSAGVSAGIDLALALVEHDFGREVALDVARLLVLYMKRPGGQSQFSSVLASQRCDHDRIAELLTWMEGHPAADLRVPALSSRVGMSPRNFARVFRRTVRATPAEKVRQIRLEAARRILEDDREASLAEVAARSGFGSAESLRRQFGKSLGVSPGAYRARFGGFRE